MSAPAHPCYSHIGPNLRRARRLAGLTQRQLAWRLGIHSRSLCLIEQGKMGIALPRLQAAAVHLQTPIASFFEGVTMELPCRICGKPALPCSICTFPVCDDCDMSEEHLRHCEVPPGHPNAPHPSKMSQWHRQNER